MRRRPAAEPEPELLDEDEQEALVAELDADAKRLEKQMRLAHALYFMIYAALYLCWTFVHYQSGVGNEKGEPYIYSAVNWAHPDAVKALEGLCKRHGARLGKDELSAPWCARLLGGLPPRSLLLLRFR